MRVRVPKFALIASTGLAVLAEAVTLSANAEPSRTVLAVDLDFAASVGEPDIDDGGGAALRIGRKLDLLLVSLTPEVAGSFHEFTGGDSAELYRGMLGGRVAVGKIVEPSIFSHVGIGRLSANSSGRTAPTIDVGLALDFTLLPIVNIGAHASYNALLPQSDRTAFDWYLLGVHAALEF